MAEVSRECKLGVDPDTYVESFRPFLMDIMYAWSKGASFKDICGMTGGSTRRMAGLTGWCCLHVFGKRAWPGGAHPPPSALCAC